MTHKDRTIRNLQTQVNTFRFMSHNRPYAPIIETSECTCAMCQIKRRYGPYVVGLRTGKFAVPRWDPVDLTLRKQASIGVTLCRIMIFFHRCTRSHAKFWHYKDKVRESNSGGFVTYLRKNYGKLWRLIEIAFSASERSEATIETQPGQNAKMISTSYKSFG